MNDDYLWDKSGDPDPQIQDLEELLAPLRYQPKPPAIPRRRNYLLLAIAATVLLALLSTGLWLRLRPQQSHQPHQQAKAVPSVSKETPAPEVVKHTEPPRKVLPKRNKKSSLSKREREEALAAKQQLMLALRLASEKLKLVHKKTHGAGS